MTELTRQQQDPVGAVGARVPAIGLVVAAFLWALTMTLLSASSGAPPALMVLALALFAGAGGIIIRATNSYRAPFTARAHFLVHVLVLLSFVVWAWATWQLDDVSRDAWPPLGLGLMTVAISAYRPVRELVGAGTLSAIFMGVGIYLHASAAETVGPPLAPAIVAMVAVLALCYGAAAFAHGNIGSLERAHRRADVASEELAGELRDGIIRSVQHDRISTLNRDVVPFLANLVTGTSLSRADRDRSRVLAASIRSGMVAEVDRSWLETLVHNVGKSGRPVAVIQDAERLAPLMNNRQRAALRALLVAFAADPSVTRPISIVFTPDGSLCAVVLSADADAPERALRAHYESCMAVMRSAFPSISVEFRPSSPIVRFSYEPS